MFMFKQIANLWEEWWIETSIFSALFLFIFTALYYTYQFEEEELICRTKGYETVETIDGEYVCIHPMWDGGQRG